MIAIIVIKFMLYGVAIIGVLLEIAGSFYSHKSPVTMNNIYRVLLYILLATMSYFLRS